MLGLVARMKVVEVAPLPGGTRVKLQAVTKDDDPWDAEIKKFLTDTPQATFQAVVNDERAREQFQPGDQFYVSLERVSR